MVPEDTFDELVTLSGRMCTGTVTLPIMTPSFLEENGERERDGLFLKSSIRQTSGVLKPNNILLATRPLLPMLILLLGCQNIFGSPLNYVTGYIVKMNINM
jgi:hypothetical protein